MKKELTFCVASCVLCVTMISSCKIDSYGSLKREEAIQEVIGHLYRWHLDEVDIRNATQGGNDTVWVRQLNPQLDEGDKSIFAELVLPVTEVSVTVKKSDYTIEETGVKVLSRNFKIVSVARLDSLPEFGKEWVPVKLDGDELRQYLFAKRGVVVFPDEALAARLRDAVNDEIDSHFREKGADRPSGVQIVHCAPLSPIADEVWLFWETGRLLIHFASDMDLQDEKLWEQAKLVAKVYDIDEQVVVSQQEAPGSNAYLTRDQVGRALYNCIILGKRYEAETASE